MTSKEKASLFKNVVAYVDVWSSDKRANYSQSFIQQLEEMGAQVSRRFNKQVTHVVFNNGHLATWRKAKKRDVRLVSALWVKRCFDDGGQVDEDLFPASNDESNPVMRNRKHRCMLPKDSPEKTTENDWRMKKKLDKMMKDLTPVEPQVVDVSPIIIDQENGIIYSPALKRSDYMAQRLKDMKDKRENISPTASQAAESCSPTGLKPSLGSTPTMFGFKLDDQSDDTSCASVAELGGSPDKEECRSPSSVGDSGHLKTDSSKPWLSPCCDTQKLKKRVYDYPRFDIQVNKEGCQKRKSKRESVRKQSAGKFERTPDKNKNENFNTPEKSAESSPLKSGNENQKLSIENSFSDNKARVTSIAVNSPSSPSQSARRFSAAASMSDENSQAKETPRKARLSFSALVRTFSDSKRAVSSSTDRNDVFDDYFSPANPSRKVLPNLPGESKVKIPFELDFGSQKRKPRRSESLGSGKKKLKLEENPCSSNDAESSLPVLNISSVTTAPKPKRKSTVESEHEVAGKLKSASISKQPGKKAESEQQKQSGCTGPPHNLESGENVCSGAAGLTEILSEAEENHNPRVNLSLQKMVNNERAMRTLVMTSMPTEKQHTVVQVVKALGGFAIVDQVCESTTHVVSGRHRRTLNILLGIARGCWILSFEWILWCLEQRKWIPEEPYELSDQFPAAQICRLQRHLSAGEHQQDLFQDQPAIFVSQLSQPPTQSLVELIELCGGTVCKTVRQAGICIGNYSGRRPEGSRILSEQWILDSITNLKVQPYDIYELE